MPAKLAPDRNRGLIIASGDISGDERSAQLLARLIALLAPQPRVVVLGASDAADESEWDIGTQLVAAGAGEIRPATLRTRADSDERALLDTLDHAQLIMLATNRPLRLSTLIGGTALARAIRRRNSEGCAVLGSGAAAALLCEHMLTHGGEGATPRSGGAHFAPGLGLTNRVVIDQGGHASDRLGRLLAALALNPFALGLGLDSATAAAIGPDNVFDVVGSGGVTVIDPAEMSESNIADVEPGAPIRITNLRLHALTGGARYDLDFRRTLA